MRDRYEIARKPPKHQSPRPAVRAALAALGLCTFVSAGAASAEPPDAGQDSGRASLDAGTTGSGATDDGNDTNDTQHLSAAELPLEDFSFEAETPLEASQDSASARAGVEASAGEVFGHSSFEVRVFPLDPVGPAQPEHHNMSMRFEPGYVMQPVDNVTLRAVLYGQLDEHDPQRTHVDAREALVEVRFRRGAFRLGINTVFWGVTESRHLVNIVNQTDYLADLDGDEKLGQLMGMLSLSDGALGSVETFVISGFRPQLYPSELGRPGVPVPVLDDAAVYGASLERWNIDLAARWSHSVAGFDWALSYFYGTSREPQFVVTPIAEGFALQPQYDLIHQGGIELQWTWGDWLWKGEGIARAGQGPAFAATTVGFEYTIHQPWGTAVDLGILAEYNHDRRDTRTFTPYDDDAFAGLRLSLNDRPGTEVLLFATTDVKTAVTLGTLQASRRIGEHWKLELRARLSLVRDEEDPFYWFRRDHYGQARLEHYF